MSKAISIEYYESMSGNSLNYLACKPHFLLVPYYVNVTYGLSGSVIFCTIISQMTQFLDTVQLT